MIPRTLAEIAVAVGGDLADDGDVRIDRVVTDSRTAGPGALFVALAGERLDGNAFAQDAFARGASAALVSAPVDGGPAVRVTDTGAALLALGADERTRMEPVTVVGVTGANGKTSTKDLAAAVLSRSFLTHASPASFNNEIGVPMTLLGAPVGTEVVVAELGARHVGDVTELCAVARPSVAVVTNVGVAHMEFFGSWEAIVGSGAEAVEALPADGTAVLNLDDPVVRGYRDRARCRVIGTGTAPDADVRAESVELDGEGRASFSLVAEGSRTPVHLPMPGEHMVHNALAAAAVGLALGVEPGACAAGLDAARISHWRMETSVTPEGVRILNDAYNANPESMAAGLRTARWIARDARLVAVLGHMAELGPIAFEEHERVGRLAVRIGVDRLVTGGERAEVIARAAVREGALPEDVASYADASSAAADVRRHVRRGDVVFLKGSRVAGLERVAEALA
ncbi:MAG: UDP-N-acetylmuramoyl-tripeptide--D-alanyl-D-alanine ligase [Actinomycetota bacterium]